MVPGIRQRHAQRMDRPLYLASDDTIAESEFAIRINPRLPWRHRGTPRRRGRQLLLHASVPQLRIRNRHRRLAVRRRLTRSARGTPAHPKHHGFLARTGRGRFPRRHGRQPRQGRSRLLLDQTAVASGARTPGRNPPRCRADLGMGRSSQCAALRIRHGFPPTFRSLALPRPVSREPVFLRLRQR